MWQSYGQICQITTDICQKYMHDIKNVQTVDAILDLICLAIGLTVLIICPVFTSFNSFNQGLLTYNLDPGFNCREEVLTVHNVNNGL